MPLWKSPSVGDEIDSRCPRCKEETIHRVVAMMTGSVHLVICTRCNSQHRHRGSLRGSKKVAWPTERQAKVLLKYRAAKEPKSQALLQEWQAMKESAGEGAPATYDQRHAYVEGQAVQHSVFGLGFVRRLTGPNKMEVLFADQVKVLVTDRGGSGD
ncbi:MAG TPA: hypothetical protein VES58_10200 [Syntrophobacteria bacterium]|jgi:hypothetical protein|nr:hypothetical protein [Syntrophobacteria bacterium]